VNSPGPAGAAGAAFGTGCGGGAEGAVAGWGGAGGGGTLGAWNMRVNSPGPSFPLGLGFTGAAIVCVGTESGPIGFGIGWVGADMVGTGIGCVGALGPVGDGPNIASNSLTTEEEGADAGAGGL